MREYALTVGVVIAVPLAIFAGMMGAAAIALCTHGESPRPVLAMPKAILRHRGAYQGVLAGIAVGDPLDRRHAIERAPDADSNQPNGVTRQCPLDADTGNLC